MNDIRIKASRLLAKLYSMRKMDFMEVTVDDILSKALPDEIDYYYYMICVRRCAIDEQS